MADMTRRSLRYHEPAGAEGSAQRGSRGRVLLNLKGITSKRAMDLLEYQALVAVQERYYASLTQETQFTGAMLCRMHADWLGELYAWAGRYRTVELQKGNFAWPPAHRVAENMAIFERDILLRLTPCRPNALEAVATALAQVHAELLLIHPFREGNGRLARWLADIMAVQAGYPVPDYALTGPGSRQRQARYIAAVSLGYAQNYAPLAELFVEAVRRALP